MATFSDYVALAQDVGYRDQIRVACLKNAAIFVAEARGTSSPARLQKRTNLAQNIIADSLTNVDRFALLVAIQGDYKLVPGPTDAQIEATVIQVWDRVAGVTQFD